MAQYYTLDEAAGKLGIKVDDFRKKLATEWKAVRRFPDGANLRFQAREIDELARSLGRASDPDLTIGDNALSLHEEPGPAISTKKGGKPAEQTVFLADSDDEFVPLSLDDDVIASTGKSAKSGSDSDVKLEASGAAKKPMPGHDEPTDIHELLDASDKKKKKGPALAPTQFEVKSDSPKKPPAGRANQVSSEFDLTLNTDSDEFDLQLSDDDSDEVNLAAPPTRKGPRSGDSGINLQDPADSGISLEKDSSEFELQLEGDGSPVSSDRDSEFELTLDEPAAVNGSAMDGDQKDIFETDFELPAIDDSSSEDKSASTDMENSDFDLSIDDSGVQEDSGSQVVAIEEDDLNDDLEPIEDDDQAVVPTRAAVLAAPAVAANWGALPVAFLIPCVLVMFFVGLMGYELLHSMWGYHTNTKGGGTIVRLLAEQLNGGEIKD